MDTNFFTQKGVVVLSGFKHGWKNWERNAAALAKLTLSPH